MTVFERQSQLMHPNDAVLMTHSFSTLKITERGIRLSKNGNSSRTAALLTYER
jgi:hypothetical protein